MGQISSLATKILSLDGRTEMGHSYRHAGVFESIAQSVRPEDDPTIIYTSGTEAAIDSEGWFHSGDVGMIDQVGLLRVTDMIVTSGGKKVAPQKLENLLKPDPLIQQALIVGQGQPHLTACSFRIVNKLLIWQSNPA